MKELNVFISLSMGQGSERKIKEKINYLYNKVKDKFPNCKINFLDTYIDEDSPKDCKNDIIWYIGKRLEIMAKADLVVFADGFTNTSEGFIENMAASAYNMDVLEEEDLTKE